MQVETFEQTEVAGGKLEDENSPEALALIESLGLKGQQKMMKKNEEGDTIRSPYRLMTVREKRVYQTLFPKTVDVEDYRDSMVPLRVLQVIAHAQKLGIFGRIDVWCENDKPRDPVLVGVMKEGHEEHHHILARWGDALESFEVLVKRAKDKLLEEFGTNALKKKMEAEQALATLPGLVEEHLNGGWVNL